MSKIRRFTRLIGKDLKKVGKTLIDLIKEHDDDNDDGDDGDGDDGDDDGDDDNDVKHRGRPSKLIPFSFIVELVGTKTKNGKRYNNIVIDRKVNNINQIHDLYDKWLYNDTDIDEDLKNALISAGISIYMDIAEGSPGGIIPLNNIEGRFGTVYWSMNEYDKNGNKTKRSLHRAMKHQKRNKRH